MCDFGLHKDKKGHTPPISKRKVLKKAKIRIPPWF